jgi:hypothetical protein
VDQGGGIFQKRGVARGINVMLNAVGRLGQHSPGAYNGEVFLKQELYVSRDRIRDVLQSRGRV